jgi:sarcosine oxidase subunit alpha
MARRIGQGVTRGAALTIEVDGRQLEGFNGETLATVLLANGVAAFRQDRDGRPRAPYCMMGVCFECLLRDLTQPPGHWQRACLIPARQGMRLATLGRDGGDAP